MERRQFIAEMIRAIKMALVLGPFVLRGRLSAAEMARAILPAETSAEKLKHMSPSKVDARNLKPTPLDKFGSMGLSDHRVDPATWRLKVHGKVGKELNLSLDQLGVLPVIERKVLMICPGFFANVGRWKGISIADLLAKAGAEPDVTHVDVRGPSGRYEKTERFPVEDLRVGVVFLAYAVNGKTLPVKHGFPLRVVADGYNGMEWVKYVTHVEAVVV